MANYFFGFSLSQREILEVVVKGDYFRKKETGMKKLLILGSGTGGTIIAAKMRQKLAESKWEITIIDRDWQHHYQPGWLFIPFGIYTAEDCVKPKIKYIPPGVNFVLDEVTEIDPVKKQVKTKRDSYAYDWLVVATGARIMPDEVEGMSAWMGQDIHNFYTAEGAVAPLEFVFMTDWFFNTHGVRNSIEIELVTPLSAAFTKPVAAEILGNICQEKNIKVTPNFQIASVDGAKKVIKSYGGEEVPYDLLVAIPPNFGAQVIMDSGMGDPMGYVETDHNTLKAKNYESIYVIGDATNVPTSKAGAVAHYEADTIIDNLVREVDGQPPLPSFDGHAT
jgi:sulfide:quinone oxidoreductase